MNETVKKIKEILYSNLDLEDKLIEIHLCIPKDSVEEIADLFEDDFTLDNYDK